jgi:hypothetical protein
MFGTLEIKNETKTNINPVFGILFVNSIVEEPPNTTVYYVDSERSNMFSVGDRSFFDCYGFAEVNGTNKENAHIHFTCPTGELE